MNTTFVFVVGLCMVIEFVVIDFVVIESLESVFVVRFVVVIHPFATSGPESVVLPHTVRFPAIFTGRTPHPSSAPMTNPASL